MPIFELQTPDGKTYEVDAPNMQLALEALGQQDSAKQASSDSGMWSMAKQGMDTLTMGGQSKLNAAGGALVDSAFDFARGKGWNWSDNYDKLLGEQRDAQAAYNEENPGLSAIGTGAGLAIGIAQAPMIGSGWRGAAATGAGYGAAGGALQDAESISERITNVGRGAATGAVIGGAGYGAGRLAGKGLEKAGEIASTIRAPAEVKALSQFYKVADEVAGPYNAMSLSRRLNDLGPDAINADVLGKKGLSLGRGAANISADARQTLEDVVQARKSAQNTRLATDVERAAGLPAGNTKSVDALKAEAYEKVRPQINRAYKAARDAGKDVPLEAFDNIITTPVGRKAFQQALDNVTSRAARDPSAGGNLAVLDETKRLLDGYAKQAFRNSDPMASEYAATAKALRERLDALLAQGNEYAMARGLRQQAYKADEAFDLGEQLGGTRIPLGLPESAAKVPPNLKRNVARAYGASKVQSLLNKNSTEGAYNDLLTPQGRKAAQAALGNKQAASLGKALDREKLFNATNREIVGNSSTARQLKEMAETGIGTAGVGMLLGYDPTTSSAAGIIAGLGRRAVPMITRRMVTENQKAVAPFIAKLLTEHGLPATQPIPFPQLSLFLQKVATGGDEKLAKTLALIWTSEVQNTNRQMKPEK